MLDVYLAELPALDAEEQLAAIEAAAVPHMGDRERTAIVKRLAAQVKGEPAHRTAGEALASLPIPIITEPKKGS